MHNGYRYLSSCTLRFHTHIGARGLIQAGDVQWMTAGKGIMHSEVPSSSVDPALGLQLWVNLPNKHRMTQPRYQELLSKDMPRGDMNCAKSVVIAGSALGVKAKIQTVTPVQYIHYFLEEGCVMVHPLPSSYNAFIYTLTGEVNVFDHQYMYGENISGRRTVLPHHTVVFEASSGNGVTITAKTKADFVLVAGETINEPVRQYGPFVMSNDEEIRQTLHDIRNGVNGFEGALGWESEIAKQVR